MRSLKIALFALLLVASVSADDSTANASNFTCVGNPYFSAPYNPNPVNMPAPNSTQLANWNVTFDNNTGIYNFSNLTSFELCKGLIKTGSCCSPDALRKNAKDFEKLMNISNNATMRIFEQRVKGLRNVGPAFGKIISNTINLVSKVHSAFFRTAINAGRLLNDGPTLTKLLAIAAASNLTDAVSQAMNGTFDGLMNLPGNVIFNVSYQIVQTIAPMVGIPQRDIAEIFGGVKTLLDAFASIPEGLLNNFDLFPSVDKGIESDAIASISAIIYEVVTRKVNVTWRLDGKGPGPNPGPNPTPKMRRVLAADNKPDNKPNGTLPANMTGNITIPLPIILDARNVEFIFMALVKAMGNGTNATTNSTEMFNRLLKNASNISADINRTLISNMTDVSDMRVGGDWTWTRTFFVNLFQGPFQEVVKRVATVAENKKKCMKVAMQYQGYVGCLACDPSNVALGKVKLGANNTFAPVLSSAFGNYIQGNCSDYFKDLVFVKNFMNGANIFMALAHNNDQAQRDPTKVDADPKNFTVPKANFSDFELNFQGSLNDPNDTWIRTHLFDAWGPTIAFLCDFSPADNSDCVGMITGQRNPLQNKTLPPKPQQKRMLDDSNSTSNSTDSVTYSDNSTDDVSTTDVGYNTTSDYTVDTNETSNITADTTQENNTDSTNSTDTSNTTNTSNSTNATNGTNGTNGSNSTFALKTLVSIPLILATIFAFLL